VIVQTFITLLIVVLNSQFIKESWK